MGRGRGGASPEGRRRRPVRVVRVTEGSTKRESRVRPGTVPTGRYHTGPSHVARGEVMRRRTALGVLVLLGLAACGAPAPPNVPDRPPSRTDDAVVVASFDFPESAILGELYAQALEGAGVPVKRELVLGPRELVAAALEQGLVDVVPEYLGSALAYHGGEQPDPATEEATRERLAGAFRPLGVRLLQPAPAEDQNSLVVTEGTALVYDLRTTSDLADVATTFRMGGPPECPERAFCLQGLEQVYGLQFRQFVPLDSGGPLTLAALREQNV